MVGASPLPAAVRDSFQNETGVPSCEGYGLTEATCATARNFVGDPRLGWVGQRLPYQKVKAVEIDRETGEWKDLAPLAVGNLAISGPTVFPGYVVGHSGGRPILDPLGTGVDGWLDTGDLARVDTDGYAQVTGRAKDLIIRGGHNIDPAMIEDALLLHPAVTGAAAVVGRIRSRATFRSHTSRRWTFRP
jgi:fatty-acyl-CoA synthase